MRKRFEFIESLRGGAALYVFLAHFVPEHLCPKRGLIGVVLGFGQEAVMLFFLLSGFVIAHSMVRRPDQRFGEYFKKRFLRIYPVFVAAMASSWLLEWLQARAFPEVGWWEVVGNLAMLQDFSSAKPGTCVDPFMGNFPLWSLSYEWWFYMLFFPIARYVPARLQRFSAALVSVAGLVSYLFIPNQISLFCLYFFIWWVGVELCRSVNRARSLDVSVVVILGGICVALLANAVVRGGAARVSYGTYPVLLVRHFAATLLCVTLYICFRAGPLSGCVVTVLRPLAAVAPWSYGLYALQYPWAISVSYLAFLPRTAQVIGYFVAGISAAYLVEAAARRLLSRKRPDDSLEKDVSAAEAAVASVPD